MTNIVDIQLQLEDHVDEDFFVCRKKSNNGERVSLYVKLEQVVDSDGVILILHNSLANDGLHKLKNCFPPNHELQQKIDLLLTEAGSNDTKLRDDVSSITIKLSALTPDVPALNENTRAHVNLLYDHAYFQSATSSPETRDEGIRTQISFYIACMCALSPELHEAIVRWACLRNIDVVKREEAPTRHISDKEFIKCCYYAMALSFKTINEDYFSEWSTRRLNSLASQLGLTSFEIPKASWATNYAEYLRQNNDLIKIILEFVDKGRGSGRVSSEIKKLLDSIELLAAYSGMTTIQTTHKYITSSASAVLLDSECFDEAKEFIRCYKELVAEHGSNFKYARVLNLGGINELNISKYPNISWIAWYSRTKKEESYKRVIAPKPTKSQQVLKELNSIKLVGQSLADVSVDQKSWLQAELGIEVTEGIITETRRQLTEYRNMSIIRRNQDDSD